jgi:hypothetical protein
MKNLYCVRLVVMNNDRSVCEPNPPACEKWSVVAMIQTSSTDPKVGNRPSEKICRNLGTKSSLSNPIARQDPYRPSMTWRSGMTVAIRPRKCGQSIGNYGVAIDPESTAKVRIIWHIFYGRRSEQMEPRCNECSAWTKADGFCPWLWPKHFCRMSQSCRLHRICRSRDPTQSGLTWMYGVRSMRNMCSDMDWVSLLSWRCLHGRRRAVTCYRAKHRCPTDPSRSRSQTIINKEHNIQMW